MNKEILETAAEKYTIINFETAGVTEEFIAEKEIAAFKAGAEWNEDQLKNHILEYIKKCLTITKNHKTLYCIDLEAFKENI